MITLYTTSDSMSEVYIISLTFQQPYIGLGISMFSFKSTLQEMVGKNCAFAYSASRSNEICLSKVLKMSIFLTFIFATEASAMHAGIAVWEDSTTSTFVLLRDHH